LVAQAGGLRLEATMKSARSLQSSTTRSRHLWSRPPASHVGFRADVLEVNLIIVAVPREIKT
jgi:hypothetical protein